MAEMQLFRNRFNLYTEKFEKLVVKMEKNIKVWQYFVRHGLTDLEEIAKAKHNAIKKKIQRLTEQLDCLERNQWSKVLNLDEKVELYKFIFLNRVRLDLEGEQDKEEERLREIFERRQAAFEKEKKEREENLEKEKKEKEEKLH